MARLEFEEAGWDPVEVPEDVPLIDAVERLPTPLIFGCAMGHCAVCLIRVLEGADALNAPTHAETYLLTEAELADGVRLACKVRLMRGRARVTLEP